MCASPETLAEPDTDKYLKELGFRVNSKLHNWKRYQPSVCQVSCVNLYKMLIHWCRIIWRFFVWPTFCWNICTSGNLLCKWGAMMCIDCDAKRLAKKKRQAANRCDKYKTMIVNIGWAVMRNFFPLSDYAIANFRPMIFLCRFISVIK